MDGTFWCSATCFLSKIGQHANSSPPFHPSLTLIATSWQLRGSTAAYNLLGKIPTWLDIPWQETKKTFPELVEGNIIKINKNSTKIQALWTLRGFLPSKTGVQGKLPWKKLVFFTFLEFTFFLEIFSLLLLTYLKKWSILILACK